MATGNLSLLPTEPLRLDLPDADVRLWPQALQRDAADALLADLLQDIPWQTEDILIFSARRRVPRLVSWHGDPGTAYSYSGTAHEPLPWTPRLLQVRDQVQNLTGHVFNSVLLNLYRNGQDSMGWHADDEPELGRDPAIASVSLGATRLFKLRHRRRPEAAVSLDLAHGDVLLMAGATQHACVHSVPKTARAVGARINLTWRWVRPAVAAQE
jgi:alkylated DNA repair dioxygenase AlkB